MKCNFCLTERPDSDFRKNAGRKCKGCRKQVRRAFYIKNKARELKQSKERYEANRENILQKHYLWVERMKKSNPKRLNAYYRTYRLRHPDRVVLSQRKYRETHSSEIKAREAQSRINNRHKLRARYAVSDAIRSGRMIKPATCSQCGEAKPVQGHHKDYSNKLNVEWLCATCHASRHSG